MAQWRKPPRWRRFVIGAYNSFFIAQIANLRYRSRVPRWRRFAIGAYNSFFIAQIANLRYRSRVSLEPLRQS
jgi:predicted amidophosphoribosyltransferase